MFKSEGAYVLKGGEVYTEVGRLIWGVVGRNGTML